MKNTRIFLCCILAALICMMTLSGVLLYQNWKLDNLQQSMLEELDSGKGCYDPQSIVLRNTSKAEAVQLAELLGAQLRITQDGGFAVLYLPEEMTIRDVVAEDENREILSQLSIDYQVQLSELSEKDEESGLRLPVRPAYSVSDDSYGQQHYLDYLNMGNIWASYTGSGVTVAVIDTGIDTDHPEFVGRISEYSYNATEDKIVKDYQMDWSLIEDEAGHGTAVTGVLAASMNADGIVGIAPDVEIIVIKAECDENGNFKRSSDLVFALYYAIERDVQVVNMSFGVGQNIFTEAVQLAYDSDVICVASAGNESTAALTYPAADPLVIGVGALESDSWNLADYSNYGENVDIVAPGTAYTSAMGGGYETKHGTSMSAPQVAGAIALFMQNNRYTTFDNVTEVLYASGYDLGDLGRDWYYGFGGLDVHDFLLEERGTVTFEMLTDELENEDGLFIRNHTIQELPEPERLYAVFDGWYYDDMFTEEYNYYSDVFTGDLTLYAKWVNEDDGIPYTYVILDDGTVEIRSYTGHRRFITIPEMIDGRVVSSIGDFAFTGQTRLREVTLPSGLTNIGRSAFAGCSNLVTMHIPANVTQLGDYAFADNVRLSTLSFAGNKLTTIGGFAFSGCNRLERIELPSSVNSVDGSAFYGAIGMQRITVRNGNAVYTSQDGALFTADGSKIVAYPAGRDGEYSLSEACTEIGDYAFACSGLRTIDLKSVSTMGNGAFERAALETLTIPDGVTSIGSGAFASNVKLTHVQLGNGLTKINSEMFKGCFALQDIHIPAGIQSIDGMAFGRSGLKTVSIAPGSRLETIGDLAFYCCAIETISIPDSVTAIGASAFYANPLISVFLSDESRLNSIGMEAFRCCWLLTGIDLPGKLEIIDELSFANTGLYTVTVPASVTTLGDGAFAYCNDLSSVTVEADNSAYHDISGVVYSCDNTLIHTYPAGKTAASYTLEDATTSIGSYAFAGTSHLTTVYLSDILIDINEYGFDCSSIDYITIPDSVIRLGRYSFTNCLDLYSVNFNSTSNLARIGYGTFVNCGLTSFTVPANVSTMGQEVFVDCDVLTAVTFAANHKLESLSAYIFRGCENLRSITFLPGSALTSVQAHGLEGMAKLTSIDFGDARVTNIDNFAFRFCTSLSSLELPETVTNVGRYAFYGCESLSELTLPENVEHIGNYAFLGTTDLQLYLSADHVPEYLDEDWDRGIAGYYVGVTDVNTSGDYKYATLTSGGVAVLEYLGSAESVDLTTVELGAPITAIGGKAFLDSTITSVTLPDSLTEIQAEAFAYTGLNSVTIPANVTFIGREAFVGTDIAALNFASGSKVKTIEQKAFAETKNLADVTIPASVTALGSGVFQNSGLTNVTFASGIQLAEIPQRAFMGTKLESVALPDSVTLVNHNAFNGVETLKTVTFGNNDGIRLMSNAFYRTGLTSLNIPANVTYIGEFCFVGLEELTSLTVDAGNPNYKSEDGLLLSENGRKLIAVPAGREGSLTVPISVEEIGFGAFERSALRDVKFDADANILTLGCRAFFEAENLTSITIPASVVSIDYYAFAYCENLKSVSFAGGNNLKGIYEGAFCGDRNLENITVPSAIVEISDFAFYGCEKLNRIPMEDSSALKGIYDYAFAYTGISGDFTTPENLIDIGNYAFMGTKVEKVTVPDTKQKELLIGLGAFEGCNELTAITLPFIGASFEDMEISWFGYIFGAGSYEANETYVPMSLKTVTITKGITTIGIGGFAYCTGLDTIDLPVGITELHHNAFASTSALYALSDPVMVYNAWQDPAAEEGHFGKGLSGHLALADGVTTIGYRAFQNCSRLSEISIPDSVDQIYEWAFFDCGSLSSVVIPKNVKHLPGGAFSNCLNLKTVLLPKGLKSIGESAFSDCNLLQTIVLPESITQIGNFAFYRCMSLKDVDISNLCLTNIEDWTFGHCNSLTNIVIPDTVTSIGEYAFLECFNLSEVTLPQDLSEVGYQAFYACDCLYTVNNHSKIPLSIGSEDYGYAAYYAYEIVDQDGATIRRDADSSVTFIDTADGFRFELTADGYTLRAYTGDEETITLPENINGEVYDIKEFRGGVNVILPDGITVIPAGAFSKNATMKSIVIPETVLEIESSAFSWCTGLESIVIPDSVTTIGTTVFSDCYNLREITFGAGVTKIGGYTFFRCYSLNHIDLPETISSIEESLFYMCSSLERIEIPGTVEYIGGFAFEGCDSLNKITIPSSVCTIDAYAFRNCGTLSEVVLESGVIEIGAWVFYGCDQLVQITVPDSVTAIGSHAFPDRTEVIFTGDKSFQFIDGILYDYPATKVIYATNATRAEIVIPDGVTEIGYCAFKDNTAIREITIPDTVTTIGIGAFEMCTNLKTISIPDSVTTIGYSAFYGCTELVSAELGNGITELEYNVFCNCHKLTSVKLPETLTCIGEYGFNDCIRLSSVTIPDSVVSIGNNAFSGCSNLTHITIGQSVSHIAEDAFFACDSLYEVYNNSQLNLEFGSTENGRLVENAKVIIDEDGCRTYSDGGSGDEIIDTADGFRFVRCNEDYKLISYFGALDTVTLPDNINGNPYDVQCFTGAEKVIIPSGFTTISGSTFCGSYDLLEVVIPESVESIGDGAFDGSGLFLNPVNWKNDALILDDWLVKIENTEHLSHMEEILHSVTEVYTGCNKLKTAFWTESHLSLSNLKTLVIPEIPNYRLSVSGILTLENVVILDSVGIGDIYEDPYLFSNVSGVTFWVEANEADLRWDDNFPGWNNGNQVIYGNNWIWADFYDTDGTLLSSEPLRTSEVIRRPVVSSEDERYYYELIGWDLDGDGAADMVPATSATDINAVAVYQRTPKMYTITFKDAQSGEIYSQQKLAYGAAITPPADPVKEGCIFDGWSGYSEGMTVSGNMEFTAKWHTHAYQSVVTEPTCTEQGYTTYTCKCGENYIADYAAALGHNFGEWVVITEDSLEARSCSRCGHIEQRTIASLENPFNDVTPGSFYYDPVMWAIENGITNGTSATTFGPNDQCMRAHVVTFLWRVMGCPEPTTTENPFVDVKTTDFYYKPVLWAVETGITSGMDATHFGPTAYCNRAQVVTFLYRAMGNPEVVAATNPFTDVAAGSFYENPVLWAVENGVTAGLSATSFGPNSICNRAQIVTFLYRAFVD